MHVDWNWIKQRPHFVAEELTTWYDIKVVHPHVKHHKNYKKSKISNDSSKISLSKVYELPLRGRLSFVGWINKLYLSLFYKFFILYNRPDIIWFGFPNHSQYIPKNKKYQIIYDCMDNASEFFLVDQAKKKEILELEKNLVDKSSIVFASSKYLKKILEERYIGIKNKTFLIRNAFNGKVIERNKNSNIVSSSLKTYKIGYIGTVSSWFDFELLLYTLNHITDIEFHIIGPIEVDIEQFQHARMKYYGAINHDELQAYVEQFDALIMPFQINDLILSVDPVKLYEYINFDKPIFSVFYEEIERFSEFVTFYSSKEELLSLINHETKVLTKKYSDQSRIEFLKENTWQKRVISMHQAIQDKRS